MRTGLRFHRQDPAKRCRRAAERRRRDAGSDNSAVRYDRPGTINHGSQPANYTQRNTTRRVLSCRREQGD
ncbi:hypothetical protein E2C01_049242 [Portunus trituberculatus]|uniref:Uncharacterized protein n=1 Tax=Portunus trituberculatus TaxID=210409 RepID=A0A5B7G538_PORTR|nr:hypothetical protein [Portunus trituberculatus]